MVRLPRRLQDVALGLALLVLAAGSALDGSCDAEGACSTDDTGLLQSRGKKRQAQEPAETELQAPSEPVPAPVAVVEKRQMKLHLMEDKGLNSDVGAVCLDGSPGAFYVSRGVGADADNWLIFLEGGGWCTSPWDCYVARANTTWSTSLGSSVGYEAIGPDWMNKGVNSLDCSISPFCNYSQVYVRYCDGTSFSGNQEEPAIVLDSSYQEMAKVYFRGQRIFDAMVATLLTEFGMNDAKKVVLSGCSAGGLAATLHADYLYDLLQAGAPKLEKYGTAPTSGFFLDVPNALGEPIYPSQLEQLFVLANWTTLYPACAAANPDSANCNFAPTAFKYIRTPFFLMNSALDWWQTRCVLADKLWNNGACEQMEPFIPCSSNITTCTGEELAAMNGYMDQFYQKADAGPTLTRAGNGAFINGCHYHCEGQENEPFTTFEVDGVTMKDALAAWWASDGEEAEKHTYKEQCRYGQGVECNPTCTVFKDFLR